MLDLQEISLNMCIITVLYTIVHYYPGLKKYSNEIKFNVYRSLMCITFTCIGINIMVEHFGNGSLHPFSFQHDTITEAFNLFMTYLVVDVIYMISSKNKRIDLYVHHILIIIGLTISNYTNCFGYIQSIILICESLSIVSGIDSMAIEDKDNKLSYYCKKFRKNIIKYVRGPIWITALLIILYFIKKLPILFSSSGIIVSVIMLYMDKIWENKCNKVIDMYE